MKVTVRITQSFKAALKPLIKKYPTIETDLLNLEKELIKTPRLGTPLGKNAFKIRLKISSKGKEKSGGGRVITLVEATLIGIEEKISEEEITVNMVMIYDKSDTSTISDKELRRLINNIQL